MSGNGCIPINNLMEDAATAEIARVQLWQWVYHGALLVRFFFSIFLPPIVIQQAYPLPYH